MPNFQRYIFGFLGIIAIVGLVFIDKVYVTAQPVPDRAYLIVGLFIIGCLVGAENLTNIISLIIKRFTNDKS